MPGAGTSYPGRTLESPELAIARDWRRSSAVRLGTQLSARTWCDRRRDRASSRSRGIVRYCREPYGSQVDALFSIRRPHGAADGEGGVPPRSIGMSPAEAWTGHRSERSCRRPPRPRPPDVPARVSDLYASARRRWSIPASEQPGPGRGRNGDDDRASAQALTSAVRVWSGQAREGSTSRPRGCVAW